MQNETARAEALVLLRHKCFLSCPGPASAASEEPGSRGGRSLTSRIGTWVPALGRRQDKLARSAGASPAQEGRSGPPDSECCVNRSRDRVRSVHSEYVGCAIEPRNGIEAGAETVETVERNMSTAAMRGNVALPGSKSTSRAQGSRRNLRGPATGRRLMRPAVRIGKARSRSR